MFLVGLISWWYGRGWIGQWRRMSEHFSATLEFFSIGQLLITLFSPYRQISAGTTGSGAFGDVFRAAIDKLISRIIGAIVRFFTIIIGAVFITGEGLYAVLIMISWWLVPLMPVAGFVFFATGWVPSWT